MNCGPHLLRLFMAWHFLGDAGHPLAALQMQLPLVANLAVAMAAAAGAAPCHCPHPRCNAYTVWPYGLAGVAVAAAAAVVAAGTCVGVKAANKPHCARVGKGEKWAGRHICRFSGEHSRTNAVTECTKPSQRSRLPNIYSICGVSGHPCCCCSFVSRDALAAHDSYSIRSQTMEISCN